MMGRLLVPLFACGILTVPCLAQTDGTTPPANTNPPASSAPANPSPSPGVTKKVWTNDDIRKDKKGVSVVGDNRSQNYHMSNKPADGAAARIRKDLEKLQGQIDEIDKKLKTYKQFQEGEPVSTGARDVSKGVNRVPVDQQIAQLQEKRKQLEAQMNDLYDEARKQGIDPGQLR